MGVGDEYAVIAQVVVGIAGLVAQRPLDDIHPGTPVVGTGRGLRLASTPALTEMPEPVRRTEIDSPVIAVFAAALGVPGQTRKEYDA